MISLMVGGEEVRTNNNSSTGGPSIVQLPMIAVTICLVGGWMINNDLEWRRRTIMLAQEEEKTKQQQP